MNYFKRLMLMVLICLMALAIGCKAVNQVEINEDKSENNDSSNEQIEQLSDEEYQKLCNQYVNMFYDKELDALYDKFGLKMKEAISLKQLKSFNKDVLKTYGKLVEVTSESIDSVSQKPYVAYLGTTTHDVYDNEMYIQFFVDYAGTIEGFYIEPKPVVADSKYLDYETKTALRLPFEDTWYVYWGGRTIDQNYHAAYKDQRFASDWVIVKEDKSYKTDGKQNEDYYAFGKDVLAPGDGKILAMGDGIDDNVPGVMNPENPMGNYIIIDHLNGEYSFIAHFKKGTIVVKEGDEVISGQILGQCGNSGNSSEPHIHYHLQDTGEFGKGEGLPAFFNNYTANGEEIDKGEPLQAQFISPK